MIRHLDVKVSSRIERDIQIASGDAVIALGTPTYVRAGGLTLDLNTAAKHRRPILVILWPGVGSIRPDQIPAGTEVHRFTHLPKAEEIRAIARAWLEALP